MKTKVCIWYFVVLCILLVVFFSTDYMDGIDIIKDGITSADYIKACLFMSLMIAFFYSILFGIALIILDAIDIIDLDELNQ